MSQGESGDGAVPDEDAVREEQDFGGLGRFGRNPGWIVTGVAAVCYGLLVAFLPLGEPEHTNLIMIGALVVAALFIAFFLGAFVIWFFRRALGMYDEPGDPRK